TGLSLSGAKASLTQLEEIIPDIVRVYNRLGRSIGQGLEKGVNQTDQKKLMQKKAREGAQAFQDEYEISSPSKLMMRLGNSVMQGAQKGIQMGGPGLLAAIRKVTTQSMNVSTTLFQGLLQQMKSGFNTVFAKL